MTRMEGDKESLSGPGSLTVPTVTSQEISVYGTS